MPGKKYASIRRPRVYEALRKKGHSKERAAKIANSKAAGVASMVVAPHGPGGLFSTMGLSGFPKPKRKEGEGERTFVRSDDGKFAESPGGGASEPEAEKPKKATKKKPAAKKPDKAAVAAENLSAVGDVLNANDDERLGKGGLTALADFGDGKALSATMQAGLQKAGLVKTDRDGVTSLTPEGRKVIAAAKKGDADAVGRALDDAGKRVAGAQKRSEEAQAKRDALVAKRDAKRAEAEAKKLEKKPGKGGGSNTQPTEGFIMTPERQALLNRLGSLLGTKDMRPGRKRLWRMAYQEARKSGMEPQHARKAARQALRRRDADRAAKAFERAQIAVFKDASGKLRWILRTTTAYRDRDGEILSQAALERDAARMTATKHYGPLRYWHVGAPNPGDPEAPWGPGIDLGMCDYSTVIGRTAIESGTFYDNAIGAALKASADEYEISPGFFHPDGQPDASGVYSDIYRFERSIVPTRLARASNLFTGLHTTKETRMTPEELKRRMKAFLDDMREKGVDSATAQAVIGQAVAAEKAATQRGIAYKEQAASPAAAADQTIYMLGDQPGVIVGGAFVALKAATVKAPMPPAEMVAAGTTEAADGALEEAADDAEADEGDDDGPILGEADLNAIAERVVAMLMGKMGDVQSQLNAVDEELKMRGYSRMKEATDLLTPKLDALTAVLKEYVGDLPATSATPAAPAASVTSGDDPMVQQAARNVGAKTAQQAPRSPEEALVAWMERNGGGAVPWSVNTGTLPDGVNPAQHLAPQIQR